MPHSDSRLDELIHLLDLSLRSGITWNRGNINNYDTYLRGYLPDFGHRPKLKSENETYIRLLVGRVGAAETEYSIEWSAISFDLLETISTG